MLAGERKLRLFEQKNAKIPVNTGVWASLIVC